MPTSSPMFIQPAAEDHALRDVKIMLREALEKEWYRANQAGHATRDYTRRDLVKSHLDLVANWKPLAPAGPDAGRRQSRPPAVERADRLQQMLADLPQLDRLLEHTDTVGKAMKDARAAQERMTSTQSFSRWRNPFAKAARVRYPGAGNRPQGVPATPAVHRAVPTAARRAVR